MAKRKTAPSASKQGDGAKKPTRKPRIKKSAKLPEPFTQGKLTASYSSIPAADLEPIPLPSILPSDEDYFESLGVPGQSAPTTDDVSTQGAKTTKEAVILELISKGAIESSFYELDCCIDKANLNKPLVDVLDEVLWIFECEWDCGLKEWASMFTPAQQPEPSEPTQFPPNALRTLEEGETDRERTEGNSTKDTASNTLKAGTQAEDSETRSHVTPLSGTDTNQGITGDDSLSVAETVAVYAETQQNPVIPSRARMSGESRPSYWESMRKTARAAGLPRGQGPGTAYEWATVQAEREYAAEIAPLLPEPTEPEPIAESVAIEFPPEDPEPENSPIGENLEVAPAPVASDQGVPGLGTMPDLWGTLPANASLQVEISWVSANRLRVRDGSGVDLSKALSPAPSYSALSWLETSILFPSKFADISVKATANQDDERESIRREKLSIEEIRGLLAEMLEG